MEQHLPDHTQQFKFQNNKILIICSEQEMILLFNKLLTRQNYEVDQIAKTADAAEFAKNYQPALILIDISSPDDYGYEIGKQIKKNEATSRIPVIMLLQEISETAINKGFQAGASDIIKKNFLHSEFYARVNAQLTIHNLQVGQENKNKELQLQIQEKEHAEALLKESEERYRLISGVITDYMFSTVVLPDGSLSLNWVAGAFESISGYTIKEYKALGGWRATLHPDDLKIDDRDIEKLRNNQKVVSELRVINNKGEIVWVQVFAYPVWDAQNKCLKGIYGAVQNITDRKSEEELRLKSENRFRALVENNHEMVSMIDLDGKITYMSPAVSKNLGYSFDELMQLPEFDLVHPDELEDTIKSLEYVANHPGVILKRKNRVKHKNGHWIWTEGTLINLLENENIKSIITNYRDITDRVELQTRQQEYNQRLQFIIDNSPIAIWDWDIETDKWYATKNYYTMLGYEPEDKFPDRETWVKRVHPDHQEIVRKKIENILTLQNEEYCYDAKMLHADGTYRWQSVISKVTERGNEGKAKHILGVRIDINEKRLAEEKLIQSEKRFREFLEKINLISVILDFDGNIVFANDFLLKLTGFSREELIGSNWFEKFIPEEIQEVKKMVLDGMQKGEMPAHYENQIKTKSGKVKEIKWSNVLQFNPEGKIISVASIGEDITEIKRSEKALKTKDKLLRLTGEMAKVGGWEFETKTMKGTWTEEVAKIHGLDPQKPTDVNIAISFYPEPYKTQIENAIKNAINYQVAYELVLKLIDNDGIEKWVKTIGIPIVENGKVVSVQGTFQDLTLQKKTEDELVLLNSELEQRVKERTKEYETLNADLARINKLFVGRELKMIELKSRIKELENQLKNPNHESR